jgi:gliding motility-associated-like protein
MRTICIFIIYFFLCLTSIMGQSGNNCGVIASMNPSGDSVYSNYTSFDFTSTSSNATSYKFYIDGVLMAIDNPLSTNIPTGLSEIMLVAYNGNCSDTIRTYHFFSGFPPPNNLESKVFFGLPFMRHKLKDFIKYGIGGYLIAGERDNPSSLLYAQPRGIISKINDENCIKWTKRLETNDPNGITEINHIAEDNFGNIYAIGTTDFLTISVLFKLDAQGNLIFSKKITSFNGTKFEIFNFKILQDGGIALIGKTLDNANILGVIRLSNTGNILWQKSYQKNILVSEGLKNIIEYNGAIYIGGIGAFTESNNSISRSIFMKIDLVSGNTIWTKTYNNANAFAFFNNINLSNNGFICDSYISQTNTPTTTQQNLATLIRLDTNGNFIYGKILTQSVISSTIPYTTSMGSKIVPLSNKQLYIITTGNIYNPVVQLGSYYQNFLTKLDSNYNVIWNKSYTGAGGGRYYLATLDQNETLVLAGNELAYGLSRFDYYQKIMIAKLDSSGVNQLPSCPSSDLPININSIVVNSIPFQWNTDNFVTSSTIQNYNINLTTDFSKLRYGCPNNYVDSCSFFKLTGPSRICNLANIYSYKIHKNKSCNQNPTWIIPAGVTVISQTDTLLKVRFSAFGNYLIKANIALSCSSTIDSFFVVATSSSALPLNLGNDFSICTGNSAILHAGTSYFSYEWQNGSTDSLFTLNTAGQYHVKVTDSCGNILRDTINVTITSVAQMNAGLDRVKCNNDTIHLSAPIGYSNYQWSPAYNVNTTNGQDIIANPILDTSYFIQAEITPGCYAFDTIKVNIKNSPPINLGPDRNLCFGDSVLLNVGSGFVQYLWSNSSNQQQIWVNSIGNYFIKAIYSNSCISSDTFNILNIKPLPVVNLDHNQNLCIGETRLLDAGLGFVSYLWNNNLISQKINISSLGLYKVTVTDFNGCKGSDSTEIQAFVNPPANFLLDSIFLCNYEIKKISSIYNYKNYLWSTGDISKEIIANSFGDYYLTVTDLNNCKGKDSISVLPKICPNSFFIPNAFSPDGNGKNDLFKPIIRGDVSTYDFKIYNRYGSTVFSSNNPNLGWNGNIDGVKQIKGVFIWTCSYKFIDNIPRSEKGTVLLVR